MNGRPSASAAPAALSRRALFALTLVLAAVWFGCLGYRHLIRTDEGRYAEIAREMVVSGDWVTPRYNDYKYFEKPPLQAWITAGTYTLFGIGDWQARLWTALSGFLTVLAVGYTGARLFGRAAGVAAAAVLASAPMWSAGSHFNTLDMGLSATMAWALCALLLAQRDGILARAQRHWMWACWAAMALAVLSKGLVGIVLPGMVLVAYTLLARDWTLWRRLHLASGIALLFAIAAPWFIVVSLRNPEFAHFFFIHEHVERFTTNVHSRQGPLWYFVPLLLVGMLPWLAQAAAALPVAWRAPADSNGFRPRLLLLVWSVLIFVFFSVSHSKLPGYVMPVFPALALLAGDVLGRGLPRRWSWQLLVLGALALAGVAASPVVAGLGRQSFEQPEYAAYAVWVGVACAAMFAGCVLAWRLARAGRGEASLVALAGGAFAMAMIAGNGHETLGRSISGVDLARAVRPLLQPGDRFYAVRGLDHTLPFYLGTAMTMVEDADELAFGAGQEPEKFSPDLDDFARRWQRDRRAFALMAPATLALLRERGLPMVEVAHDARRVIVAKPGMLSAGPPAAGAPADSTPHDAPKAQP